MGTLLEIEGLTKRYGDFAALDSLSLSIQPGEVFGLLGPNGSGKTTALRMLLGFLQPSAGWATIMGHDCWRDGVNARRHVAYLPGELRLYDNMNGRQLIQFLCDLRGQKLNESFEDLAGRFDIDLKWPIAKMSSGMKRKIALLAVLVPHTPLVIMDEPTNTLDPNMRDELLLQVKRARERGQAVLFSSHVMHEVEQVCDRVGVLKKGKLVHVQHMSELQKAGRLIKARLREETTFVPFVTANTGIVAANSQRPHRETRALELIPGLVLQSQEGNEVVMEFTGEMAQLLVWLADQPLEDLRIEPLGLTSIYHRYHGVQP